ncbi:hypothetical protein QAD02_006868 [Eretmocerus hayati]|uniref:Uncharacterized protein n=1 Tax=Eretmocerus hayati TaxID=131215 RepID=A0ACC2N2W8_9HYME|nr:hypothetical protein QAD02_006868 [Eretmocerus hayati]
MLVNQYRWGEVIRDNLGRILNSIEQAIRRQLDNRGPGPPEVAPSTTSQNLPNNAITTHNDDPPNFKTTVSNSMTLRLPSISDERSSYTPREPPPTRPLITNNSQLVARQPNVELEVGVSDERFESIEIMEANFRRTIIELDRLNRCIVDPRLARLGRTVSIDYADIVLLDVWIDLSDPNLPPVSISHPQILI